MSDLGRSGWRRMNKNASYFFRLEKHHSQNNTIQQLNMTGLITDDPKLISNFSCNFYGNLYSSKYCEVSSTPFFDSLGDVKSIGEAEGTV